MWKSTWRSNSVGRIMSQRRKWQPQLTWVDALLFAMTVVGMGGFVYLMVYR